MKNILVIWGELQSVKMKDGIYIDSNFQLHYPEGASMLDDFPDDLR